MRSFLLAVVVVLFASPAFAQPQPSKRWLRITQAVAIGSVAVDISGTWASRGIGNPEQNPFYPQDRRAIATIQTSELAAGLWALERFHRTHPKLAVVAGIAASSASLICGVRSWRGYQTVNSWRRSGSKWR